MDLTTSGFSRPTQPFVVAEYTARLASLKRRMQKARIDALIIEDPYNRVYLTGFPSDNGLLCVTLSGETVFYTDFRYLETARNTLTFLRCAPMRVPSRYQSFARVAARAGWRRVGYDGAGTTAFLERVKQDFPGVREWVSGREMIQSLRAVKSLREQAIIRNAVRMGDLVFAQALESIRPGMTEWGIRVLIRRLMDEVSQGESFDTIVCAGSNASRCHHHPSMRVLRRGQELLMDMGVKVDAYCSDMTRVVFLGPPSSRVAEIYKIVLEANQRAIAGLRAGDTCCEADSRARKVIEKAGYGRYFGHGLGHGVGLEIHEPVSLGKNSKETLLPGMVVTIEPGIYLPGVGGVRIEDVVIVRERGCEVLTATPKTLRIL